MDQLSDHEKEKIERLRRAMYSRTMSEKMKERERREFQEKPRSIGEEWNDESEATAKQVIAPRFIGATRALATFLFMAATIVFLGVATFALYYVTFDSGSSSVVSKNIDISVVGPLQISGGEPVTLQIAITNRNNTALELADLVVRYPDGARSVANPAEIPVDRISLGAIESGGRRQGTVSAVLQGKGGDRVRIPIELEYRIADSNSIYVARTEYTLSFLSSPLSLVVEGNTEVISGQTAEITVSVKSNATTVLKDVAVSAEFPFGFIFDSSEPASLSERHWSIGDLRPGEKKTITIRGVMRGEQGEKRAFRFFVGTKKKASDTDLKVELAEQVFTLSITEPFVGLTISANKGTGANAIVVPGETVTVTIDWKNNISVPISNAVIVARLSGMPDNTPVKTTDGFFRSSDNVVLWDRSTTGGALATLSPGSSGSVSFSFEMPSSEALSEMRDPRLVVSVNTSGSRLSEKGVPENLQSAAVQTIKVASDLQIIAQGLYYTNPFVSSGPMPPQVGKETTYAIVFTVLNTTNTISKASLTAELPSYVRWTGVYSPASEKIDFDPRTGRIVWSLGDIAPGVGVNGTAPRQAAISVGLSPSLSQVGTQPVLVEKTTLAGTDEATGSEIARTTQTAITTNLANVAQSTAGSKYTGEEGFSAANATVIR